MHFDDHLVRIVYNGESGVSAEAEHAVVSILIDKPGLHHRLTAGRRAERASVQPDAHAAQQPAQHAHTALHQGLTH